MRVCSVCFFLSVWYCVHTLLVRDMENRMKKPNWKCRLWKKKWKLVGFVKRILSLWILNLWVSVLLTFFVCLHKKFFLIRTSFLVISSIFNNFFFSSFLLLIFFFVHNIIYPFNYTLWATFKWLNVQSWFGLVLRLFCTN